jgi:hypothetical protein|nr:MAG TPA: putative periplasmic lipoprotein [Caudoviricetes sp.]
MFILKSNRPKHFIYAIPSAFLFTILFAAGLAVGMEFKDRAYGGKWDWLDLIATMIGGLIGQLLQAVVIYLILKGGV